jgi:hypothetical protein
MANASEKELKDFLKHFKGQPKVELRLTPCGMNTTIDKKATNICEVVTESNLYTFGGIRESYFDKMVTKYDTRNDNT